MDGQIECRASGPAAGPPGDSSTSIASPIRAMSGDRHDHLEVELLARPGIHDPDVAAHAGKECADRLERSLGGGQADALRIGIGEMAQALEAEPQVRAALGGGDRMHLVHDHVLDAAQHLARLAGQQEIERLRAW